MKIYLIFCRYNLLVCMLIFLFACEGAVGEQIVSQVEIRNLNVKYLSIICKTWGLMKYYHPNVISGQYDWDKELFHALNKISQSSSDSEFQKNLLDWIKSYGPININDKADKGNNPTKINAKIIPDFSWIETELIPDESRVILKSIVSQQVTGTSYYVNKTIAGGAQFTNEKVYENLGQPDVGFRFLTLFRYWNYIEYFYPYKYLAQDWDTVLEEFIPLMYKSWDEMEYRKLLWRLFTKINDSHANLITDSLWRNFKGVYHLPIKLSKVDNRNIVIDVYDDDYVQKEYLLPGDEIIMIDGITLDSLFQIAKDYIPASNYRTKYRDFLLDLVRSNKKELSINYVRNGMSYTKKCTLKKNDENYFFHRLPIPELSFMDFDSIAYINLVSRKAVVLPELINKKIIIIDLRGSISNSVENFLGMPELIPFSVQFAISSEIDNHMPGRFIINEKAATISTNKDCRFKGKIVILVNEFTQSNSEFMSMFYQSLPNSIVVGSQTAGTDGNMTFVNLPGGIKTGFTGVGVFYPDGSETQEVGIKIDRYVEQSLEDFIEGRDTQLEMALQISGINK